MDPSTMGERIQLLLKEKGLTQRQLADYLTQEHSQGANYPTINKWIKNKAIPRSDTLSYIADFLDTDVNYLLCRTDDPTNWKRYDEEHAEQVEQIKKELSLYKFIESQGIRLSDYDPEEVVQKIDLIKRFIEITFAK
jgi:transcriptional regulator with XRE-family HTH domain